MPTRVRELYLGLRPIRDVIPAHRGSDLTK
jgi:hypothetical protein